MATTDTKDAKSPFMANVSSILKEGDMIWIRVKYNILADIELIAPRPEEHVYDYQTLRIAVHEECLRVGIKFPFEGTVKSFFEEFNHIVPCQFVPNTWCTLHALSQWGADQGVFVSGRVVRSLFAMTKTGDFISFKPAKSQKSMEGLLSSTKNWK